MSSLLLEPYTNKLLNIHSSIQALIFPSKEFEICSCWNAVPLRAVTQAQDLWVVVVFFLIIIIYHSWKQYSSVLEIRASK